MNRIPNFLKNAQISPNKKTNPLSVNKDGQLVYLSKKNKPAKLSKIHDIVKKMVNDLKKTKEICDKQEVVNFFANVIFLNLKFNHHNKNFDNSIFGKLVNLAERYARTFFSSFLADLIHRQYHIDEIDIDNWSKIPTVEHKKTEESPENEDPDQGSSSGVENRDNFDTTVIHDVSTDSIKTIQLSDSEEKIIESNESIEENHFASGPKWGLNYAEGSFPLDDKPPTLSGKNGKYYFIVNPSEKPLLLRAQDCMLNQLGHDNLDMKWEEFTNNDDSNSSRSHINLKWSIIQGVECTHNHDHVLMISNRSKFQLKVMSEQDKEPRVIPKGKSFPLTDKGYHMFWLEDKDQTGFFIIKQ